VVFRILPPESKAEASAEGPRGNRALPSHQTVPWPLSLVDQSAILPMSTG
jgi:hypothetical protein